MMIQTRTCCWGEQFKAGMSELGAERRDMPKHAKGTAAGRYD